MRIFTFAIDADTALEVALAACEFACEFDVADDVTEPPAQKLAALQLSTGCHCNAHS